MRHSASFARRKRPSDDMTAIPTAVCARSEPNKASPSGAAGSACRRVSDFMRPRVPSDTEQGSVTPIRTRMYELCYETAPAAAPPGTSHPPRNPPIMRDVFHQGELHEVAPAPVRRSPGGDAARSTRLRAELSREAGADG